METINYEALEAAYHEDEVAFLQEQLRLMPFVVDFRKQREKLAKGGDDNAKRSGTYVRRTIANHKGTERAGVLAEFTKCARKIREAITETVSGVGEILG